MKFLLVLATVLAVSAGSSIPLVPGDNSYYVEGESRYIWMADGDDSPQLVDLHEPVDEELLRTKSGDNNVYWLYTRQNPKHGQMITHGNPKTIWTSCFIPSRQLKVIVHGWSSDGMSTINSLITSAFLAVIDANVIVVDWHALANSNYITAAKSVPSVGRSLGEFLDWLISTAGGNWENIHMVGFDLGAHVVGNAGRIADGSPVRITGLDPAGVLWRGNLHAINRTDGIYVECIHTDGGILGTYDPICTTDFYPNGGRHRQPGCLINTCSHSRAYELFAATIYHNHLNGWQCDNINQTHNDQCIGSILPMGNHFLDKRGHGIYGLSTGSSWPF